MEEYRKGRIEDFDNAVDFANLVFHIDFRQLLPKLYGDNKQDIMKYHHMILEDNKIKAMVGCFPINMWVGSEKIKTAGIGTVSVHPYSRGKDYMKRLMKVAINESEEASFDMMVLGGARQRYEYFGFTPCATRVKLYANKSNLHHCKEREIAGIHIEPFDTRKSDADVLDKCVELHRSLNIRVEREETQFLEISSSWDSKLYIIYQNQELIGYFIAVKENNNIIELVMKDSQLSDSVLLEWLKITGADRIEITANPYDITQIKSLSSICERMNIQNGESLRIMNYPKVLKTFLKQKQKYSPLMEGEWVIEISGKGRYCIRVEKEQISVEETTKNCHASMNEIDAMNYIFSPSGYLSHMADHPLEKSWFPIPMYIPYADMV